MLDKLRFWCNKVIPLVYDEALSYYEVLCKVAHKINELVESTNTLFSTTVFKVNDVEPVDGNVTLTPGDFEGIVGSVNGVTPVDGNVAITATDVPGTVRTVNGISPNSDGEVKAGTIRVINGKSPSSIPTPGSVTLTAADVGALPNSIDPVETVNGISPDSNGNVNVGTVKSVNNTQPDANGNVNLPTVAGVTSVDGIGPDGDGDVVLNAVTSVNGISPTSGNVNVGTVTSVNSITPTNGNVDVGTVTSVASIEPINGNVALVPSNIGFLVENLYVNGSSGSDDNNGKTAATAFKTIQKALTVIGNNTYVSARTFIHIATGTYNEHASVFVVSNKWITLVAEGGNVTISGLRIAGAMAVHFKSSDNTQYGFNFTKGTATPTYLAELSNEKIYTECPLRFDANNDTTIYPLRITTGAVFIIGYRGQLTFNNVGKETSFYISNSILHNTWSNITATPAKYEAEHALVMGVTNMTAEGTALTI